MSSNDRRPYLTALDLNQTLLDAAADNLVQKIEMIAKFESPIGTIRVSDRAKYVGTFYYEPRVKFPEIKRTVGEWLSDELEFSSLELTVNNTDKKFNEILPGGTFYGGFIGKRVNIEIGLGEKSATYKPIFSGVVTDVAGISRSTNSFTLTARNDFERVNLQVPQQFFNATDFPLIEEEFVGLGGPVIYGDWTVDIRPEAPEIPAYPINGNDPLVNASLEDPLAGDEKLKLVIASTPIKLLDTASVTLRRGDKYYVFDSSDIAIVPMTNNTAFEITQKNLMIESTPWIYARGDEFYVKCKGVDLGALDTNIVRQARDMLIRLGGLTPIELHSTWTAYSLKSSPPESDISTIKSRVWIQEATELFKYVASMLEQVRLEPFVNRDNQFELTSLHFDDFQTKFAAAAFTAKNWDVVRGSFKPKIDERNNWNRARADYAYSPAITKNRLGTPLFRNQAAINQAGKPISKLVVFPNLYIETNVVIQLKEMLKLASCYSEMIDVSLVSRSVLTELGDVIKIDVKIGSVIFNEIPAIIRSIEYTPTGLELPMKLWSLQMVNFPGYTGPTGTVGGFDALIELET